MKGHWRWVKSGTTRCDSERLRERVSADHTACRVAVASRKVRGIAVRESTSPVKLLSPLPGPASPIHFSLTCLGPRTANIRAHSLTLPLKLTRSASSRAFCVLAFFVRCFLVSLFPFFTCSVHFSCFSSWTRSLMRPALGPWTILQSCALCFCALCFCALSRFQIALLWFRAVVPFVCGRGNAHQPTTHNMQTKQRRPAHSSQPTAALQPSHPTPPHPTHKLTIWTPRMDRMETASTLQYEKGGNI